MKINGKFHISLKEDDKIVEEITIPNAITVDGDDMLGRYLTDDTDRFINFIALGLDNTASVADGTDTNLITNTSLGHEIVRKRIMSKGWDDTGANSLIISYHVNFGPNEVSGKIKEIGTFDKLKNESIERGDDYLIAAFDNITDGALWSVGTIDEIGADFIEGDTSLLLEAVTANTIETTSLATTLDLTAYDSNDLIQFMVLPSNVPQNVTINFLVDSSNYFKYQFNTLVAANWNLLSINKGSFTEIGSPDWGEISYIEIKCKANAGSATDFNIDSLRMITVNDNSTMFSRAVISTPKNRKQELLVSYDLEFSF